MYQAMILEGVPRSLQSRGRKGRKAYMRWIAAAYAGKCGGYKFESLIPLYARIVIFESLHVTGGGPDVDNIAKPILDALKGEAYQDDRTFARLYIERRDLEDVETGMEALQMDESVLADALALASDSRAKSFFYVEIGADESAEFIFHRRS